MILHLKLNVSKKKCSQLSIIPFFHKKKKLYFVFFKMGIVYAYLIFMTQVLGVGKISNYQFHLYRSCRVVLSAVGPYVFSLFVKANNDTFLTVDVKQEIRREYESYITSRRGHSPSGTVHTYDERSHLCTA